MLFDKHAEKSKLVDEIAGRIQLLGGVSIAMAQDVVATTIMCEAIKGPRACSVQVSRLLLAHEIVLKESRTMARLAGQDGDDLMAGGVIRANELQAWFVAEHVVDTPVRRVED
jgi:starvation-inducible DNA-binding protein